MGTRCNIGSNGTQCRGGLQPLVDFCEACSLYSAGESIASSLTLACFVGDAASATGEVEMPPNPDPSSSQDASLTGK